MVSQIAGCEAEGKGKAQVRSRDLGGPQHLPPEVFCVEPWDGAYDIFRFPRSFSLKKGWMPRNMVIMLIGNKCDLDRREVSFEEGAWFARQTPVRIGPGSRGDSSEVQSTGWAIR